MKVILPVAGHGKRLKPLTNTCPKCLISIAGQTLLEHICDSFSSLEISGKLLVAGYLSEAIENFVQEKSWKNTKIILQKNPQGLAQAISLCMPEVEDNEPILIILGDTLFDANLSFLREAKTNILLTRKVENPERFGVAVKNEQGKIVKLVEKPKTFVSDEALVGIYYIKDTKKLKEALNYLLKNNIRTKGEFQLTDALQKMLEAGVDFETSLLNDWLDCGTPEKLIETNAIVLKSKNFKSQSAAISHSEIIEPCYIGANVIISDSVIGPNVTIDDNVQIENSKIENTLVGRNSKIKNSILENSCLGSETDISNVKGSCFLGDNAQVHNI